jgi:serine/threonine protein kinase
MHLIDLIALYTLGKEVGLVFPYVAGTLEKVLTNKWKPAHVATRPDPLGWILNGLIGLADGLATIHHPPKQYANLKVFAFHFDLKPSNVLITSSGIFKITDFGQALLKAKPIDGATTVGAAHKVGDPHYAPPENVPSRNDVDSSSRFSSFSATASVSTGAEIRNARSNIPHRINQGPSRRRSVSAPPKEEESSSTGSARYDIWSLACVMLETLIYHLEGSTELESFRADRNGAFYALRSQDTPSVSVHEQYELKICVETRLQETQRSLKPGFTTLIFKASICPLLWDMFSVQASKRPSANDVKKALLDARQTCKDPDLKKMEKTLKNAFSRSLPPSLSRPLPRSRTTRASMPPRQLNFLTQTKLGSDRANESGTRAGVLPAGRAQLST